MFISGCSSVQTQPSMDKAVTQHTSCKKMSAANHVIRKNPINVAVYTHKNPDKPYVIIGKEIISKYNLGGIKRQEASLHDTMRNLAASIGGDAVINVEHHNDKIIATVIAYNPDKLA